MKLEDFQKNGPKLFDKAISAMREESSYPQARFRASGIADCPRAMTFSLLNLPDDQYKKARDNNQAKGLKLMQKGTDMHEFTQKVFIYMGLMTEDDMEEKKRVQDDELMFSGHPDGILTFDDAKVLLEIKTINDRGFKYLNEPKEAHFYQGQAYLHFVEEQHNVELEGVLYWYVQRESDDAKVKIFYVKKDQEVIDNILNKITVLGDYLKKGELYPIPAGYDPDDKKFIPCRWCPFNTPELCKSKKTKISDFPGHNIVANI